MYEIVDIDILGRIGKLRVKNKTIVTPNLFPVVHPYNNTLPIKDLRKIGAQCLFTNAYILYNNEEIREEVKKKGIHNHLDFKEGLIATDSGAFQQYIYNSCKITINPKEIEAFQEDIRSDFPVILDIPVQLEDDYEVAKKKVITTIERAKDNIMRRSTNDNCWFGPIHGGKYPDLLKYSSEKMNELDFGVYAIGGLVKAFLNYRFELAVNMLLTVKQHIIPNKPIHMFGLGLPQFFSLAVACGCDLMDSAAYVLFAKQNRYFTLSTGTEKLESLSEFPCHCPICCTYTPNELLKLDENIKTELLAKHNLYLSFSELKTIRQAIRQGNLWELVQQRIRTHPTLVSATRIFKKYSGFFEKYEKRYKKHGRLYTSQLDLYRPLLKRHGDLMKKNYRAPKEAKYIIILPEYDTRVKSSPSMMDWLEKINSLPITSRKLIHIQIFSSFFGLIPLELQDTYPLSQHESFLPTEDNMMLLKSSLAKSIEDFNKHYKNFISCGILIPNSILNQYNEEIVFPKNHFIFDLYQELNNKYSEKIIQSDNLKTLLKTILNEKNDDY
ncbi:MAG: tRNA guanosine(15) transglycosylase TgtA [Promethearchaeota archaeon]